MSKKILSEAIKSRATYEARHKSASVVAAARNEWNETFQGPS